MTKRPEEIALMAESGRLLADVFGYLDRHDLLGGARLGDLGYAIEQYVRRNGYSVVREYCGHGIGREMHESPQVAHWGKPKTGLLLREGMVFTIEPMVNPGQREIRTGGDGWTVLTRDGQLSAQFEHTVAVTKNGVRVLTLRPEEAR